MTSLNGARSVLDLIGSTPVVKLRTLPGKDDAEVWAKMESFNPGGSVKDRICLNMIETAERQGKLKSLPTPVPLPAADVGVHWHERFEADPGNRWLREQVFELFED